MTEHQVLLDPSQIYFTHSKISRSFSGCGRKVEDTIDDILSGRLRLECLPQITVIQSKEHIYSLNNRRLYVLKHLRDVGFLTSSVNMVKCRLKAAKEREKEKYTIDRCTLVASFMRDTTSSAQGGISSTPLEDDIVSGSSSSSSNSSIKAVVTPAEAKSSPKQGVFASLSEKARREYKNMLNLARKGKVKEFQALVSSLLLSNHLTEEQAKQVSAELLRG